MQGEFWPKVQSEQSDRGIDFQCLHLMGDCIMND